MEFSENQAFKVVLEEFFELIKVLMLAGFLCGRHVFVAFGKVLKIQKPHDQVVVIACVIIAKKVWEIIEIINH